MDDPLARMSLRQKSAFLACIAQLASDTVTEPEAEYIEALAASIEYPEDKLALVFNDMSEDDLLDMLEEFQDEALKRLLVRELFFFAYTEDKMRENEIAYIAFVSDTLGLSSELTERISDWVSVGLEWERQGTELFGEDG